MILQLLFIDIYRRAFESSSYNLRIWDNYSLYLYIAIILVVYVLSYVIEVKKNVVTVKTGLSFVGGILFVILGCRNISVGTDTYSYCSDFIHSLDNNAFAGESTEIGYQYLLRLLRLFWDSPSVFIAIWSLGTISLIFSAIYIYRKKVNLFVAISCYVSLYFFQSMNLIRIYFAAAIIMYFFKFLLTRRYNMFLVGVLVAFLIHYSSIILILLLALLLIYQKSHKAGWISYFIIMMISLFLVENFAAYIQIDRYALYAGSADAPSKLGVMLFFDYLPCMYFIFYAFKHNIKNQWTDLLVVFTMLGFLTRLLAYYLPVGGRLSIHFMALFLLILPYFVNHLRLNHKKQYPLCLFLIIMFLIVKIHLYFIGYLAADGIIPYSFIWD